jgi:hypothetical protein
LAGHSPAQRRIDQRVDDRFKRSKNGASGPGRSPDFVAGALAADLKAVLYDEYPKRLTIGLSFATEPPR